MSHFFQSNIFSFLGSSETYESKIIEVSFFLANKLMRVSGLLYKKTSLLQINKIVSLKSLIIFLFIFSFVFSPDQEIQLTEISTSSKIDLNQRQFGIPLFYSQLIFLLLLGIIFLNQFPSREKLRFNKIEILIILFFIISEVSVVKGVNYVSSTVWLLKLTCGLIIYFIFSRIKLTKKELKLISYAFVSTILIEGIMTASQLFKGNLVGLAIEGIEKTSRYQTAYLFQGIPYFRITGTFSQPNFLTAYLALLLPFCLSLRFSKNKIIVIFSFITAFICIASPLFTLSRWGLLTIIFVFSLNLFLLVKKATISLKEVVNIFKLDFVIFFILGIILLSSQFTVNRFLTISTAEDKNLSLRMDLISQATYIIQENPLIGVGAGNFTPYLLNHDMTESFVSNKFLAPVHNSFLLLASETGLISVIVMIAIIITVTMLFLKRIKSVPKKNRVIAIGIFTSLIAYFFNGLWTPRSFDDRIGFLFWLLLGLLANILNQKREVTLNLKNK